MPKALLVGVAGFEKKANHKYLCEITSPPNDVALVEKALLRTHFKKNDIVSLTNRDATITNIRLRLQDLIIGCEPDESELVILYFSCHGRLQRFTDEDHVVHLLPWDAEVGEITCTGGFRIHGIDEQLRPLLDRRATAMFIDACHSGSVNAVDLPSLKNSNILASCRAHQEAVEVMEFGLFTLRLVEALCGCGGSDHNGDVTMLRACTYVSASLPGFARRVGHKQNAWAYLSDGSLVVGKDITKHVPRILRKTNGGAGDYMEELTRLELLHDLGAVDGDSMKAARKAAAFARIHQLVASSDELKPYVDAILRLVRPDRETPAKLIARFEAWLEDRLASSEFRSDLDADRFREHKFNTRHAICVKCIVGSNPDWAEVLRSGLPVFEEAEPADFCVQRPNQRLANVPIGIRISKSRISYIGEARLVLPRDLTTQSIKVGAHLLMSERQIHLSVEIPSCRRKWSYQLPLDDIWRAGVEFAPEDLVKQLQAVLLKCLQVTAHKETFDELKYNKYNEIIEKAIVASKMVIAQEQSLAQLREDLLVLLSQAGKVAQGHFAGSAVQVFTEHLSAERKEEVERRASEWLAQLESAARDQDAGRENDVAGRLTGLAVSLFLDALFSDRLQSFDPEEVNSLFAITFPGWHERLVRTFSAEGIVEAVSKLPVLLVPPRAISKALASLAQSFRSTDRPETLEKLLELRDGFERLHNVPRLSYVSYLELKKFLDDHGPFLGNALKAAMSGGAGLESGGKESTGDSGEDLLQIVRGWGSATAFLAARVAQDLVMEGPAVWARIVPLRWWRRMTREFLRNIADTPKSKSAASRAETERLKKDLEEADRGRLAMGTILIDLEKGVADEPDNRDVGGDTSLLLRLAGT